ncbi:hypothetical protein F2P79_020923 [Pimephales promelas]|nr:hypothetical protein F2P79_020923 [Pimephales promelas]
MAGCETFVVAPSEEALEKCTKEQLLKIAEHYSIVVAGDKRIKENIKMTVKAELIERGIITEEIEDPSPIPTIKPIQVQGLTFEQQKELLVMQMDHEKLKHELEIKKQIELERIRQQTEKSKLDLEEYRLSLGEEGRWPSDGREQFRNTLPGHIATYVTERKFTTAAEAAESVDEYVLLHKGNFRERTVARDDFGWRGKSVGVASGDRMRSGKVGLFKADSKPRGSADHDTSCNYCHDRGHWKTECPVLQSRNKFNKHQVKPAAAAAPVDNGEISELFVPDCEPDILAAYGPFIRSGFVSLVGDDTKVPVKILRDTGAYDSFIVGSVLPLSEASDTGDRILSRGMGLTVLPAPLHKIVLNCELVQGEVAVGVRPALPIEGIHFILGNGLTGGRADAVPSPVVTPSHVSDQKVNDSSEGNSACVVTRAMVKSDVEASSEGGGGDELVAPSFSDFPLSVSVSELLQEQQSYPSLKEMFDRVVSATVISSAGSGYFVRNGVEVGYSW